MSRTYKNKNCEFCKKEYTPTAGKQRWCQKCVRHTADQCRAGLYGISGAEYDAMFARFGGRCWICKVKLKSGKGGGCVDHCHKTGKVRGILCFMCNRALAHLDTPGWLEAAQAYRYGYSL